SERRRCGGPLHAAFWFTTQLSDRLRYPLPHCTRNAPRCALRSRHRTNDPGPPWSSQKLGERLSPAWSARSTAITASRSNDSTSTVPKPTALPSLRMAHLQQRRASSQRFCWRPWAQKKASHTKPLARLVRPPTSTMIAVSRSGPWLGDLASRILAPGLIRKVSRKAL